MKRSPSTEQQSGAAPPFTDVDSRRLEVGRRAESVEVAVVMPAYNAARFVTEAIRSVLEQTLTNVQLVIVDDGSTDETLEMTTSVVDERVVVLTGPNRGQSYARNAGIAAACPSRYFAFIDADDCWDKTKLAEQVLFLNVHAEVLAVGCFMRYVSSNGRRLGYTGQIVTAGDRARIARGELFPFPTPSLVVRRSALAQAGGFDEVLGTQGSEDLDLYARLARLGPIACLPDVLGSVRIHRDSLMATRRRDINRAARFVRLRLRARDEGRDLTWEEFLQNHPATWHERRQDLVERAYRSAALSYSDARYGRAVAYGGLAVLIDPKYVLRRAYRQRCAHAARESIRGA
jgi:glycosyltransferase involved in cell wall biosynthesis